MKDICTMTDDKSLLFKSQCEGLQIFHHVTSNCESGLHVILDIQSAEENKKAISFLDSVEKDPMLNQGMKQSMLGYENKRTGAKSSYFSYQVYIHSLYYTVPHLCKAW